MLIERLDAVLEQDVPLAGGALDRLGTAALALLPRVALLGGVLLEDVLADIGRAEQDLLAHSATEDAPHVLAEGGGRTNVHFLVAAGLLLK